MFVPLCVSPYFVFCVSLIIRIGKNIGNSFVPVILFSYVVREFTDFKRYGLHHETGIESELASPLPLPC
jgi:hypothetical protein